MSKEYIAWLVINSDANNLIKRTRNLYTSVDRFRETESVYAYSKSSPTVPLIW